MSIIHFFSKKEKTSLDKCLLITKEGIFTKIARIITGKSVIDESVLAHLEEILITADIGVETTLKIIHQIKFRISKNKYININDLNTILIEEVTALFKNCSIEENFIIPKNKKPHVIMVVGVNGVGKTTTIGKLAFFYKKNNQQVFLGAADTFRVAAAEQLNIWSTRVGVHIVKHKHGSDPASVAYNTLTSALANHADVVIIDTAGRLHNKIGLMNELSKIKQVMKKIIPNAPHEVLLVLDGSTGQNAFQQVKEFSKYTSITSLAITKLDGTSKGGVVVGISDQFQLPIKYIGIGEELEDLQVFRKKEFVHSLFGN